MRILAVDYGDARTGIAVCDRSEFLASPLTVINEYNPEKCAVKVAELAKKEQAELIIVGLPRNMDGSEGRMAGNSIRCVGKYLYDNGMVPKTEMTIATASGVRHLQLFTRNGKVSSVTVDMGKAELNPAKIPVDLPGDKIICHPVTIGNKEYNITCVATGNPHCVVFVDNVDKLDLQQIGPQFENSPLFPERVNTEFVRVVNESTIKMRVWERGNGETPACGTGACAAVVAAVENGYCKKGVDVTVKVRGGDLLVNYTDDRITLTGDCNTVYKGEIEY